MKPSLLLACVVGLLFTGGCPSPEPPVQSCTMIGCTDGLTVIVEQAPAVPYDVEVIMPDGASAMLRCEVAAACAEGLFFEGVAAEEVVVRMSAGGATSRRVVEPDYEEVQPNGPGCPPTCRQGRVTVRFDP